MNVPAFWYQNYQRSLNNGSEQIIAAAVPEWRLRFTPPEQGNYLVSVTIKTNGVIHSLIGISLSVVDSSPPHHGYVGVAAGNHYFQTGDGEALRLNRINVALSSAPGTSIRSGKKICSLFVCATRPDGSTEELVADVPTFDRTVEHGVLGFYRRQAAAIPVGTEIELLGYETARSSHLPPNKPLEATVIGVMMVIGDITLSVPAMAFPGGCASARR